MRFCAQLTIMKLFFCDKVYFSTNLTLFYANICIFVENRKKGGNFHKQIEVTKIGD